MHRPTTWLLACVVALVVAPSVLLVPAARPVGAQEGGQTWEGVVPETLDPVTGGDGQPVQPYLFTFEQEYASIPWDGSRWTPGEPEHSFIASRNPIALQVLRGEFAFEVPEGEAALVDPRGQSIPILVRIEDPPYYEPAGPDEVVANCDIVCSLPANTPVQLNEGAIVYLPSGIPCFACRFGADVGSLRVFVFAGPDFDPTLAPEEFEWISGEGIVGPAAGEAEGSPTARRRWANPATHCR